MITALPVVGTATWFVAMVVLVPSISNALIRPWLKARSRTRGTVISVNTEIGLLGEKPRFTALACFWKILRLETPARFTFRKTFVNILRVSGLVLRENMKKSFLPNQSKLPMFSCFNLRGSHKLGTTKGMMKRPTSPG